MDETVASTADNAKVVVELLPGVELPSQVAQIICWALLVLALLGFLMLVFLPLMLGGIKKAVRNLDETTAKLDESLKKVAEWAEYAGSQTEEAVKQIERANKTAEDHAAAGRKRTQAQAAQAVQLGKLLQQQIEAIERNG